jgi:hypothetical protein
VSNLFTLVVEHEVHGVAVARTYATGLDTLPTSGNSLVALGSVNKTTREDCESVQVICYIIHNWNSGVATRGATVEGKSGGG